MPASRECRLLRDAAGEGAWNMAVDEALLESAATNNSMTLRLYGWSEPTLSLGYFQRYEDRHLHPESLACECTRRSSGGGAILHDRELTYSLSVPPDHPMVRTAPRLYSAAHDSLVDCLRHFGVNAALVAADKAAESKAFLCFERCTAGDVVLGSYKVAGSAQRKRHHAVLQHGSILWHASKQAPHLLGIGDLITTDITQEQFVTAWLPLLARSLQLRLTIGELTTDERRRAADIRQEKYGHASWIRQR